MIDPAVRVLAIALADHRGVQACDTRQEVEVWLTQETEYTLLPAYLEGYLQTRIPGQDSLVPR